MAGQDWSIKIITSGNSAAFQPDVPGGKPNEPLQAQNADIVSWNNRTPEPHQPWPTETADGPPIAGVKRGDPNYLADPISPWESSTPAYLCVAPQTGTTTVYYCCKFHTNERGSIVVSAS